MLATCRARAWRILSVIASGSRKIYTDVNYSKRWIRTLPHAHHLNRDVPGSGFKQLRTSPVHRCHYSIAPAAADTILPIPPLEQPPEDALPDSPPSPTSQPLFQIPPSTLQNARALRQYWHWKMFRHVDTDEPPLRHYCTTKEQSEVVAQKFIEDGSPLLGFDLEWAPSGRQYLDPGLNAKGNCSMLQLANEGRIAIFHLALFHEPHPTTMIPPTLIHLLTSRRITKLGVHISADMTRLTRYFPHIHPRSYFELSHLYKAVKYHASPALINRRTVALAELVKDVYGLEMSKEESVRASDWSRKAGMKQVDYAASDAYAGVLLFRELDGRRREVGVEMPAFADVRRSKVKRSVKKVGDAVVVPAEVEKDVQDENEPLAEEVEGLLGGREEAVMVESKLQARMKKDERTSEEKAAALARRNAYLSSMYEKKRR